MKTQLTRFGGVVGIVALGFAAACGDSSGAGGAGGSATTVTGSGSGTGSTGTGAATVNGCTEATATDHTTEATVNLTWSLPFQQCIKVKKGTHVIWTGDFTAHPLTGGIAGSTPDSASPITTTKPAAGAEDVTFGTAGQFPFFCTIHLKSMEGVVYVQ